MASVRKTLELFLHGRGRRYGVISIAALAAPALALLLAAQLHGGGSQERHVVVPALRASGHSASSGSSASTALRGTPSVITAVAHGASPPVRTLPPVRNTLPPVAHQPRE